jgi:cyclopropane fatty-acyl-phospholipid synthase-like methyltransferase
MPALRISLVVFLAAKCLTPLLAQQQVQINTPYVGTPPAVVNEMLNLAKPTAQDVIYDLGCGDGRIVIEAAKQYGVRGVGIDNNPDRIREAQENARREGVAHLVEFRIGDLYDANIENATIVALYLLPDVNLRLRPKLKSELKPGARIVSHTFDMGDWKPKKKQIVEGEKIYLWKIRRKFLFFV